MSDLNKVQKGFMITIYILTAFALLVSAFVIYNIITKEKPWTLGVTYASLLTSNDNQVSICTVSIKDNSNNNGQSLYEIQWNSYTDTDGSGISGFGIQAVGCDWTVLNGDINSEYYMFNNLALESAYNNYSRMLAQNSSLIFGDIYLYYTGDNGQVYYSLSSDDLDNYLLIDIDGQFYRLTLKEYTYTAQKDGFWNELFNRTETRTTTYSWFEVFDYIIESAINASGSTEFSEFPLALFDLSKYFDIEYKDDNGQYHSLPNTSENRNYLTIQVNYEKDGATEASDSTFKQIAYSTSWNYYSDFELDNYWNAYSEIVITEDYVNAVYNQLENSYYLTIDEKFANYLSRLKMSNISIILNLDNLDYEVYGIDLQYFNFNMESFTINSSTISELEIYNQENCPVELQLNLGGTV